MTVRESALKGTVLKIYYDQMKPECFKGTEIVINCASFRNPIYQDIWYGFDVQTFDGEVASAPIDTSDLTPSLDARSFKPYIIKHSEFTMRPSSTVVQTPSKWDFSMQLAIPLMRECYIKIVFPNDFSVRWESATVSGIFMPRSLSSLLAEDDIVIEDNHIDQQSFVINGCYDDESIGDAPCGTLDLSVVTIQDSVRDSRPIGLFIYKDELLT
jgi:hypothetical protein